jgi:hypothetical protein
MIRSRSLPGYQVSSSLTGGGAERKLGAFDSPVALAPEEQYGQVRMGPHHEFPVMIPCDRTIRGAF